MKELWTLFWTFAKMGVMTFGGGMAMLPILQREVVENKHWATEEELTDYYAIGQCTPGIIAVNTATFIGQKYKGIAGGIVATLGVVFPSLVIISILAGLINNFADLAWVQNAFAGIQVCVCVLIFNATVKLLKMCIRDRHSGVRADRHLLPGDPERLNALLLSGDVRSGGPERRTDAGAVPPGGPGDQYGCLLYTSCSSPAPRPSWPPVW